MIEQTPVQRNIIKPSTSFYRPHCFSTTGREWERTIKSSFIGINSMDSDLVINFLHHTHSIYSLIVFISKTHRTEPCVCVTLKILSHSFFFAKFNEWFEWKGEEKKNQAIFTPKIINSLYFVLGSQNAMLDW